MVLYWSHRHGFSSFSLRNIPSTFLNSEKFFIFLLKYFFSVLKCFCGVNYSNHTVFFQCNRRGLERKHFEQVTKMRHNNLVSAFYLSGAIIKKREIDEEIKGLVFREIKLLSWYHCEVWLWRLYIERLYTNILHVLFNFKMRMINSVGMILSWWNSYNMYVRKKSIF